MLYFAYGSNMNLEQMKVRCPGAEVIGTATLPGHELHFAGYGHLNVRPSESGSVPGVLWQINGKHEKRLDGYEGYPGYYDKQELFVKLENGNTTSTMIYVMSAPLNERDTIPSDQYYQAVRDGYESAGLPLEPLKDALCRTSDERMRNHSGKRNAKANKFERGGER